MSTGPTQRSVLGAYVERLDARDDRADVMVVLSDGTRIGAALPVGAPGEIDLAAPDGDDDGDDGQDDNGLTMG